MFARTNIHPSVQLFALLSKPSLVISVQMYVHLIVPMYQLLASICTVYGLFDRRSFEQKNAQLYGHTNKQISICSNALSREPIYVQSFERIPHGWMYTDLDVETLERANMYIQDVDTRVHTLERMVLESSIEAAKQTLVQESVQAYDYTGVRCDEPDTVEMSTGDLGRLTVLANECPNMPIVPTLEGTIEECHARTPKQKLVCKLIRMLDGMDIHDVGTTIRSYGYDGCTIVGLYEHLLKTLTAKTIQSYINTIGGK